MKKLIVCLSLFALLLVGCENEMPKTTDVQNESSSIRPYLDMGENIFWIDRTQRSFVDALIQLRREKSNLRIVSITASGTGNNGYDIGYFIVMESK